jgi:hypothetical protein
LSARSGARADDVRMSTTEDRRPEERDPSSLVFDWRFSQLVRAGYTHDAAWRLADSSDVEIRVAERLLESGCPLETAQRILL